VQAESLDANRDNFPNADAEDLALLTKEDLASIGRGLAEADAVLGMDGATYFEHLRQRVGSNQPDRVPLAEP
jgi:hypothetical protein